MSDGPELVILACLKNEAEDLVEWLCWHRHVDVDRFLLYDNESTDRTRAIIEAMPFADRIELRSSKISADRRSAHCTTGSRATASRTAGHCSSTATST